MEISYGWDGIAGCYFIPEIKQASPASPHGLSVPSEHVARHIVRAWNSYNAYIEQNNILIKCDYRKANLSLIHTELIVWPGLIWPKNFPNKGGIT